MESSGDYRDLRRSSQDLPRNVEAALSAELSWKNGGGGWVKVPGMGRMAEAPGELW